MSKEQQREYERIKKLDEDITKSRRELDSKVARSVSAAGGARALMALYGYEPNKSDDRYRRLTVDPLVKKLPSWLWLLKEVESDQPGVAQVISMVESCMRIVDFNGVPDEDLLRDTLKYCRDEIRTWLTQHPVPNARSARIYDVAIAAGLYDKT